MQTGTFLIKTGRKGPAAILEADELRVAFDRKLRPTGRVIGGLFREVEAAGDDRQRVNLRTPNEVYAHRADGRIFGTSRELATHLHIGKVDEVVRRVAESDVAAIREVDRQIAYLEATLAIERERREGLVKAAFRRGRKFYAGDAIAAADSPDTITASN